MSERLLIRYPIFELLETPLLQSLLSESVSVEFDTGEILFQEGTVGAWVNLVLEGKVRILRRLADGREASLGVARSGELIGDYVLLTPHQHTATARASSNCRVLRLPVGRLREKLAACDIDGGMLKKLIRLHASLHFLTNRHYLGFMSASSALTYVDFLKPEKFRAMRTLCGPGLAKDRWFYMTDGSALLTDRLGKTIELGPGDCFGSLCLTGRYSDETVSTLSDVQCLSLTVSDFRKKNRSSPSSQVLADKKELDGSQQTRLTRHLPQTRFPFYAQQNRADCGLAALSMVGDFLGIPVRDAVYKKVVELPEQGLSLLELRDLAESVQFSAAAYRIDSEHLSDVHCPFIAHLNNGHFVVVYHIDRNVVLVADPATGIQSMSGESFVAMWSGYVIIVESLLRTARDASSIRSTSQPVSLRESQGN